MKLEEELEIAKSRIREEINGIDDRFDDLGYKAGLQHALEIVESECSPNVLS